MLPTLRKLLTADPITLSAYDTVRDAAKAMREHHVRSVLIVDRSERLCGIVTDRDLVIRALARGKNPDQTPLQDVYSEAVAELYPNDTLEHAVRLVI